MAGTAAGVTAALAVAALGANVARPAVPDEAASVAGAQLVANPDKDRRDFTVSGEVRGLYPGAQRELLLIVGNPHNFDIRVTSLTVRVGNAGPGCGGANVVVTDFTGTLVVPGNATAEQPVPVAMVADPPDACRDASFPLTFGGSAAKL